MQASPTESNIEDAALDWFGELGYTIGHELQQSHTLAPCVTRSYQGGGAGYLQLKNSK